MLSYNDALKKLLAHALGAVNIEFVDITACLGRVLACDVRAGQDYPEYETAAMDGICANHSDIKKGAKLEIIASIPAGCLPEQGLEKSLEQGKCAKTFTGALMSADTLVPLENISFLEENGKEFALINEVVPKGFALRQKGESYQKGELLLKAGKVLDYADIAVLAEQGIAKVGVIKKPKIAILATGSELIELGKPKQNQAQIYNSNAYALFALLSSWGAEAVILRSIKDSPSELENTIKTALEQCDMLVSTGGVSVGEYDFMRDFVRTQGELIIDKCAIKPGRHIKIAKLKGKMLFALPGFCFSALVTARLFIKPFIFALFGAKLENFSTATIKESYKLKGELENFSAATLSFESGKAFIGCEGKKSGSSAISINLCNNAVLLRASSNLKAKQKVEFMSF